MKLAIMLTRPWSAIHRFRSFLVNAKRLEHELFCMGPKAYKPNCYDLTKSALADLGLDLLPVSRLGSYIEDQYDLSAVKPTLDEIDPDAVLGECINVPFEWEAQAWAAKHQKPGLLLSHVTTLYSAGGWAQLVKQNSPGSIVLTPSEQHRSEYLAAGLKAVTVGYPELDLIRDNYDAAAIRRKLGAFKNQPLIAFFAAFTTFVHRPNSAALTEDRAKIEAEVEARTLTFLKHMQKQNWQVVIHLHPAERAWINSMGPEGLTFSWRYPFLRAIQDLGGKFVDDVASGQIGELVFHKCDSFELLAVADCVVGTAPEVSDKAYVMEKWSISLLDLSEPFRTLRWPNLITDLTSDFQVISEALEGPGFKSDKAFTREWFSVLDRQCWRRILNVCEGHL